MLKEAIYLVISPQRVERMAKNPPPLKKGEIVVKVYVEVRDDAFREPTLVRRIEVIDPMDGIHLPDVEFSLPFITEDEVEQIKRQRVAAMRSLLEEQGWTCTPPDLFAEVPSGVPDGS